MWVYTKITSDYDRSVDFTKYKTFAWLPNKDTAQGGVQSDYSQQYTHNSLHGERPQNSIEIPDVFLT
jgi:hypothetical protein